MLSLEFGNAYSERAGHMGMLNVAKKRNRLDPVLEDALLHINMNGLKLFQMDEIFKYMTSLWVKCGKFFAGDGNNNSNNSTDESQDEQMKYSAVRYIKNQHRISDIQRSATLIKLFFFNEYINQ